MQQRDSFSGKMGFVLAAAGAAVGLGNIWRFPFTAGDGGGAIFVLVYLLFCFILCFPVMVAEIAIGRKARKNVVGAFAKLGFPKWKIIGKLAVITNIMILSFYNVIAAWAFGFFVELAVGNTMAINFEIFTKDIARVGTYSVVFIIMTSLIVAKGISGGIEKFSRLLMPGLILIIVGLAAYGLMLPHAAEGISFYLIPDFSKMTLSVIGGALGQAFFSLGIGAGILITFGSYVSEKENIISSATLIMLADAGVAFIAGLMIFPLVSYMTGSSPEGVAGGPGLIFNTLPGVFQSLGVIGAFMAPLFFLLLSLAALTSTIAAMEVPVSYLIDERQLSRRKAVLLLAVISFIITIPSILSNGYSYFLTNFITYFGATSATSFMIFMSNISGDTLLPLGGFLLSVFVVIAWKKENLHQELSSGNPNYMGSWVQKYVDFSITYIAPVILGGIFILKVLELFFGISIGT